MRRIAWIQVTVILAVTLYGCGGTKTVSSYADEIVGSLRPKALPVADTIAATNQEIWPVLRREGVDQETIDQLLLGISCDVAQKTLEKGSSLSRSDIVPIVRDAVLQQSANFAIGRLAPESGYEEYKQLEEFSDFVSENRTSAQQWLYRSCARI